MQTKLEEQAEELWQNYGEDNPRFWKRYEKLIRKSKSNLPVVKSSYQKPIKKQPSKQPPFPTSIDLDTVYQKLSKKEFELFQEKPSINDKSASLRNGMSVMLTLLLTILFETSFGVKYTLFYILGSMIFSQIIVFLVFQKEKDVELCKLELTQDHLMIHDGFRHKKVIYKNLVKFNVSDNALVLEADYGGHGIRAYKFRLRDQYLHKISSQDLDLLTRFFETIIVSNKTP